MLGPADVFCIFESESPPPGDSIIVASPSTGVRSNAPELLFLKEAKASHKLTDTIIDQAVAGNRTLEPRAIMGRGGGDSDDTEDCEYWFAAVCAQIYTSMIDKGLRYGIISAGARYVFVSINPDDLSTMRYSLSRFLGHHGVAADAHRLACFARHTAWVVAYQSPSGQHSGRWRSYLDHCHRQLHHDQLTGSPDACGDRELEGLSGPDG